MGSSRSRASVETVRHREGNMRKPRRWAGRILRAACVSLLASLPFLSPVLAQDDASAGGIPYRGTVGAFFGSTSSEQIWPDPVAADRLRGMALGVYIDVQTPLPFLSIRAEAGYAGRGSVLWDEELDPERSAEAAIRGHYLSFPVHGKVEAGLGPVSGYLFAGPTLDFLLSSDCTELFCQIVQEEKTTVVSVAAGAGVGLELPRGFRLGVEARHTEGLSEAYRGGPGSGRNRTLELLVRMGRVL